MSITERFGIYTVETSDGRKGTGATLASAYAKVPGSPIFPEVVDLTLFFEGIKESPDGGQIVHGRASG